VALMVLVTSVALAAEPVRRLVVGSAVSAWEGLVGLAGTGLDADSITRAEGQGRGPEGETIPAAPEGAGERPPGTAFGGSPVTGVSFEAALVANDDSKSLAEDARTTIDVLYNDDKPRGELEVRAGDPPNGTTYANEDGTITYYPAPNFVGTDGFTYDLSDGQRTDRARVTVTVAAVNDPPRAADDKDAVDEDDTVVVDVLPNDTDVDGDGLSVKADDPAHGAVEVSNDGRVTYKPADDFNGEDTFSYRVSDGNGESAEARVDVKVRPVNDDPVAGDKDDVITTMDKPTLIEVLTIAKDVDDDPLTVVEATATQGRVDINPNGSLTYTPPPLFIGDDAVSYVISDGAGGTDRAAFTVRVLDPAAGEAGTGGGAEGSAGGSSSGG
jgi:hypothetical protein